MQKIAELYNTDRNRIWRSFHSLNLKSRTSSEYNRKYVLNENYFEKIDTEEKAYWLGFLYADGNIFINENSYRLTFSLKREDSDHVKRFKECIESNATIKIQTTSIGDKKYESAIIRINNEKICRDLIKKGCIPNKTFRTTYPSEEIVPYHLQSHFIRGVFDGDGCISYTMNIEKDKMPQVHFEILGTRDILTGIFNYFSNNDLLRSKLKISKKDNIYSLRASGVYNILEIKEILYNNSNLFLDRKYEKFLDIEKIEKNYTGRNIRKEEKICCICNDLNSRHYHRWENDGNMIILCDRHYQQMLKGGITDPRKRRKIKCLNNEMIFSSIKEAAEWCKLKNQSLITTQINGRIDYAGNDPISGDKLKWEEYYD